MSTNTNIDGKDLGELLKSYYQGTLTGKKLEDFDALLTKDEFLADAAEGFDEFPEAIGTIPPFESNNSSKMLISLAAFAVLSLAVLFFFNLPDSPTEKIEIAQTITKEDKTIENQEEEIIEVKKSEDETKEVIVPITERNTKQKKPVTKEIEPTETAEKDIPKRDYFEIPKMELNPIEIKQKTDYTVKTAKTKALMYYDFLAIDYSVIYTNTIPVEQKLSGTSANQANGKDIGVETGNGSQQQIITYKQQLKKSLFQLKEQNYSLAIENFEIILTHFPQDANAEFYIGYSLFYQKNYAQAISYFDKAMANGFDFFYEDAEWFKANSLENIGKVKEAQKMYRKIKEKGGYYSYQVE
ncbi:MAG: tetratricopeptide repeat protein [Flavobacteriales bacterium]